MFGMSETLLEKMLDRTLRELNNHPIGSEEYVRTLNAAMKLHELRMHEKPRPVSRDTLLIVGANLFGILMIIKHENVNVIASKAIGLLLKPR